ncbi:MAG TPA: hypothetical protein DDX54_00195 [Rhodospirillaceae bacterium]|nr:hypothetical protein [Alphaproteobacteria bacterium]HBH25814.1 hypothetical protein [Rhodospirillaceae bacterium]
MDGSHYADDVMLDLVMGFDALKTGGVMLMDDYLWKFYARPRDNPAGAINAFLRMKAGLYRILHVGWQVHIQKTGQSERAVSKG